MAKTTVRKRPRQKSSAEFDWKKYPKKVHPFLAHGVEFSEMGGDNWCGTAPFSVKPDKFYVNPKTGQWDEKVLGESGNLYTFLERTMDHYEEGWDSRILKRIAEDRRLPAEAFSSWRLGWDGKFIYIPMVSEKGTTRDIRRWSFTQRQFRSTKSCDLYLGNAEVLPTKKRRRVWVVEGEWDAIALQWALRKAGNKMDLVVWTPGAGVFKEAWVPLLAKHEVIVAFDNDQAGDNGAARIRKVCSEAGVRPRYVNWPEHYDEGWDIRDFVAYAVEHGYPIEGCVEHLESKVSNVHRRDDGSDPHTALTPEQTAPTQLSDSEAPTFEEMLEVYKRYFHMDDEMTLALKFIVSIVYSQQIGVKDPLWAYLVAAAGGGKSAMLMALSGCSQVIFRSTLKKKSLISGFQAAHDPSLLPKLIGKTLIVKDFTTTLANGDLEFDAVSGVLREAYDGYVFEPFGNQVSREYTGLHFSLICGVTPAIHAKHGASMGERFLKLSMRTDSAETRMDRLMASLYQSDKDEQMEEELHEVTDRFLAREVTLDQIPLPEPGSDFLYKILAMSQVISSLRATVERDRFDKDMMVYRPQPEVGTRPFKQMFKLARAARFALRKEEYDDEILNLVLRVGKDSCIGFNVELVEALMLAGNRGTSAQEVAGLAHLSMSMAHRQLEDLQTIGVVERSKEEQTDPTVGRVPYLWRVQDWFADVWVKAGLPVAPEAARAVEPAPAAPATQEVTGTVRKKPEKRATARVRRRSSLERL